MTSADQLFRPVNISNAPDGTLYIADMYHGIIQERQWSGPGTYLRAKIEQYQLDKVAAHGRIWRLRYDGRAGRPGDRRRTSGSRRFRRSSRDFAPPRMYSETPAQLVAHFAHPNGWWRDTAQRLLVLKQDKSVVPALQQIGAARRSNLLARFHALWTLEGLGALDAALVRDAMKDANPRMRVQAIRASETLYKAGDKSFADDYRALTKDADPERRHPGDADAEPVQAAGRRRRRSRRRRPRTRRKGVALDRRACCSPPARPFGGGRGGRAHARAAEAAAAGQRRLRRGVLRVSRRGRPRARRWPARRPAR